jgi:hypothetical protein
MNKLVLSFLGLATVMAAVGCGGSGGKTDNVAACNAFVAKVKCGDVDISSQVDCDLYANTACDISDYFDCLETKYVCVNGAYDESKLATISDCTSKATCN